MRARSNLVYPIPPAPRTAVLAACFRSKGPVRVFPNGWDEEAARFAPQSVAGRLEQLEALKGIAIPTHALIVIRNQWEERVSVQARERLWRAFRVPLFEQIVDEDGTLLAAECEAHEGLHLESRRFTAGDHEIDRRLCPCGRSSPRLVAVERTVTLRSVAASG